MEGTLRFPRLPAVVLLLLCTLPARADAQQFVCWPIAGGDTAFSMARRLTGSTAAAYGDAFQIRDPARQMFVPKSQYRRVPLGWQACLARGPLRHTPAAYSPEVELAGSPKPPVEALDLPTLAPARPKLASASLTLPRTDRTLPAVPVAATIGAAVLLIVALSTAATSLSPRPMPPYVRCAGENFITAFARPLIDESSGVPPIRTRLRFVRRRQQIEISIAPGPGRRYPNLADHGKNLEYDVDRVLRSLGKYDLCKPPRAAGKWVVVTIRERVPSDEARRDSGPFKV